MYSRQRLVALPCTLSSGMFSSERVFKVQLADGEEYTGIVPVHFCWNEKGKILTPNELSTGGQSGFVAARVVGCDNDKNTTFVEVPNGEVIAVNSQNVKERPTKIKPPISTPV